MFEDSGRKVRLSSLVLFYLLLLTFILFVSWCVFMTLNKQVFSFAGFYWQYWVLIPVAVLVLLSLHAFVVLPLYTIGNIHERLLDTREYVRLEPVEEDVEEYVEEDDENIADEILGPEEDEVVEDTVSEEVMEENDYIEELNDELSSQNKVEEEQEEETVVMSDREAQLEMVNGVLNTLHSLGIDENTDKGRAMINNIHTISLTDNTLVLETVDENEQDKIILVEEENIPNIIKDVNLLNVSLKVFNNLQNVHIEA